MSSSVKVTKRLDKELCQLVADNITGVSAFPDFESGDLLTWKSTIEGPADSYYEGQEYQLTLNFPANYPIAPPKVKFVTPIYHPNIDMSGNICLDILKDKWSATYTVSTLLLSIQGLLATPNNDSPLNGQAAQLWDKKEQYKQLVDRRYNNLPLS